MKKIFWKSLILLVLLLIAGLGFWYFFPNTQVLKQEETASGLPRWHGNVALVSVGGEEISSSDVDFEVSLLIAPQLEDPDLEVDSKSSIDISDVDDAIKQDVLASMIERKMLFQYISHDRNFDKDDAARYVDCIADWQQSIRESAHLLKGNQDRERLKKILCEGSVVRQYVQEQIYPKAVVSDAEIKAYFQKNSSQLAKPERATIRQILLNDEKLAKNVRYQLNSHNFSELAKKHSQAPEGESGGLLGPYGKGEYPEIFDLAFSMRVGEISDVLKSPYGFHIFYLVSKEKSQQPTFDHVKEEIRKILIHEKQEQGYASLVDVAGKRISVVPAKQTM